MGFIDINTIPRNTRGIIYFNKYDAEAETLTVVTHRIFTSEYDALETYANTQNAESTMAGGETFEEFIEDLKTQLLIYIYLYSFNLTAWLIYEFIDSTMLPTT